MAVFTWVVIIERGTIQHQCAIDSNLVLIHVDRDMLTYEAQDKDSWVEYQRYLQANKSAIIKEHNARYKY